MLKKDEKILQHLQPYNETLLSDMYFCFIYYKNKNVFMYTITDKVKCWVENNGGKFQVVGDKKIIGNKKGFQ